MKSPTAESLDDVAAAIRRHLRRRLPSAMSSSPAPPQDGRTRTESSDIPIVSVERTEADGDVPGAVLVSGHAGGRVGAVVAAAVDDDAGPEPVIRYAAAQARRLGVPLRLVHVWTGTAKIRDGVRVTRLDRMSDADLLLSTVLYDHLTTKQAEATEREILHDPDVVRALISLSAEAALIVVAARGTPTTTDGSLGGTVQGLVGRTACPLAVLAPAGLDRLKPPVA